MFYLLGAGPRLTICLPPGPGNVQLGLKDDGPAKKGNMTNVRGTTQRGVRNTTRVYRLCPALGSTAAPGDRKTGHATTKPSE